METEFACSQLVGGPKDRSLLIGDAFGGGATYYDWWLCVTDGCEAPNRTLGDQTRLVRGGNLPVERLIRFEIAE